jgi:hypothetical protein
MDMPWYAWLSSGVFIWFLGFMSGRSAGQVSMLQMTMMQQAKAMQIPGLPPGMPGPGGR